MSVVWGFFARDEVGFLAEVFNGIGDPVRLTQVVSNLVNNGLKFTEQDGVTIPVGLASNRLGEIRLTVEDTFAAMADLDAHDASGVA
ncbi:MAG TPA: ATP-binding protein [Pararhizobium sp.]|uniref:ATP-binding protein n=1 Tax=Pararhizobium sp. TaxID=1977563 RepID=UPI002CBFD1B2|nr:ATP-binding protein [Pararhizobium sp.]HTO34365.1 ATP-binding protein [Pararhizobium sp.]